MVLHVDCKLFCNGWYPGQTKNKTSAARSIALIVGKWNDNVSRQFNEW